MPPTKDPKITIALQHRPPFHVRGGRLSLALLLTMMLAFVGVVTMSSVPAQAASHQVKGQVFRDFNSNGTKDTNAPSSGRASDVGLGGVTVTATDAQGVVVGTATTDASGAYTLDVVNPWSPAVRVEFVGLPAGYESSFHGTDSDTSVQFLTLGASPTIGVDFAVNSPEDHSQGVVPVVSAVHTAGRRTHASNVGKASLVSVPWAADYNGQTTAGNYAARTTLGRVEQTGSLWGSAFQRTTGDLFASATLRRHADLGPLGLGGIYRVSDALAQDGTINPAKQATAATGPEPWLDVTSLGVDVGTVDSAVTRGLNGPGQASRDTAAVAQVGKVGIGGIAVSSDNTLLYFTNLRDKRIYAVDIATKTLATTLPGTTGGSIDLNLAADERPWALTVHRGKVHVGYVQTGQGLTPAPAMADQDLVVRAADETDLASLGDPASEVLRSDLGYTRGSVWAGSPAIAAKFKKWHTWTDTWKPSDVIMIARSNATSWAQAMLTDLQFTTNGELVIGLQDRFSLQTGDANFGPSGTGAVYPIMSVGDVLVASPDPSGNGFTMENNGRVGGRNSSTGPLIEGPGGREFFNDANVYGPPSSDPNADDAGGIHKEIALGGLATVAGIDQVVSTAFDPTATFRTSGLSWFSTVDGSVEKGYQHTPGNVQGTGNFAKAGGIGDVQALANLAPLEIGNRVWFDADQDGSQDADEPAIGGVRVDLFGADASGAKTGPALATRTTDAKGEYYFDVGPQVRHVVEFTPPTTGNWVTDDSRFGTVAWSDMTFTQASAGGNRAVDSNPAPNGQARITTGGPGQNDHTIDAGLIANVDFTAKKVIDATGGVAATGQQFTLNFAAKNFRGDPLSLTQSSVTLGVDETSVPITVPVGSLVKVTEASSSDFKNVVVTGPAGATAVDGYYRVEDRSPAFAFTVTNTLHKPGTFVVTKEVSGGLPLSDPRFANTEFTVEYSYPGFSGQLLLNEANDWRASSPELPNGTVVTLTEPQITGKHPSIEFGTPSWKVGSGTSVEGGSAAFVVDEASTQRIVLTNPVTEHFGGFDLTKQVLGEAAERVPSDFAFVVEYSLDNGDTWVELAPVTKAAPTSAGPTNIPLGTKVLIREKAPDELEGVDWVAAVFSGVGVTAATDTEPASFVIVQDIDPNAKLQVLLSNTTEEFNGSFTLKKIVTGPAKPFLATGHGFKVDWTLNGVAQPRITLQADTSFNSRPLAEGSKVTITEITPTGGLPLGATWGTPVLEAGAYEYANGASFTIPRGEVPLAILLNNSTDVMPTVKITKGDGDASAATIVHEADTVHEGEYYTDGETRDIVIRVDNPGPEPLRKVALTDVTRSGGDIVDLKWTFPDGSVVAADWDPRASRWSAKWDATFAPETTMWEVGEEIIGRAKLTVDAPADSHQNRVRVDAEGAYSGKPVDDDNDYNAFTAAIQVIKYDGNKPDPAVKNGLGNWVVPDKPLADPRQDANDTAHSVPYSAGQPNPVRWVVTNTGPTTLTRITLADLTGTGPDIGDDWTADLRAFGGPQHYSFVRSGPWQGLLPPRASFFAEGTLKLPAASVHQDTVTVTGVPVVPQPNADGTPSDRPWVDEGTPVLVRDAQGNPVVLTDDDPFNAHTPRRTPPPTKPPTSPPTSPPTQSEDPEVPGLPDTGSSWGVWGPVTGLLLVLTGVAVLLLGRGTGTTSVAGRRRR